MPYAAKDRQEFIKRSNLAPSARVLDLGGMLSNELPSAVSGIATLRPQTNAILINPPLLPFKNSVFNAVLSYHYFDLIPPENFCFVFEEAARVLAPDSSLSFMVLQWTAQSEAQKSSLIFNELLKGTGALFQHEFESVSRQLSESGFGEITVEIVKRDIQVPAEYFREHLVMLGNLVKKEKAEGRDGIRTLAKQYVNQVKANGEAMLPAVHFMAKKL